MVCLPGPEDPWMETVKIPLKTLLLCLAATFLTEIAMRFAASAVAHNSMILLGTARLVEIFLIIGVVVFWGKGLPSIGLTPSKMVKGIKRGLVWSAGFGLAAAAASVVCRVVGVDPLFLIKTALPSTPGKMALFFWVGGLVAPVAEEIFFRGVVYGFFRRWGTPLAILSSTLVFVWAHPVFPGLPITQVVGGVVFAVAYEREKSLLSPMVIHALGNLAIFSLSLVF